MKEWRSRGALGLVLLFVLVLAGCAAGPASRFTADQPAGFWAGLWHGLICIVTFVISLFTSAVRIYETNNTGGWYDLGFLIGAAICLGGGVKIKCRAKSSSEKEWDEIGEKVERKVRRAIAGWLNEEKGDEERDWEEIGRKIEEKIKRELRDWADR